MLARGDRRDQGCHLNLGNTMKHHLVALLLATTTAFAPIAALTTGNALASTCGVDAPAGWSRPGGFCDQLSSTSSQSTSVPIEGPVVPPAPIEEEVVDPCGGFGFLITLGTGDRVRIAGC